MPGALRQGQHEPITPKHDGRAPGWIVRCHDCAFAHDAHGLTSADAIQAIAPTHHPGHGLYAKPVDYSTHPLYRS